MNVDAIKLILELVREHELAEFELEQDGIKLRIRKQQAPVAATPPAVPVNATAAPTAVSGTPVVPIAVAHVAPAVEEATAAESLELAVVTSPIVGTFYRSADPSSPPFADVGQMIRKGQTLCIIEAMKLMNEIESEYDGEIVKVYIENGQPVQYGDRLFAIKT